MKRTKLADMPPNPNSIIACLERGERVSFAVSGTDSQFMSGDSSGGELIRRFGPRFAKKLQSKAEKLGISLSGKRYISQLATEFCDPRALVSGTSDVVSRCRELNKGCEGMVNVERHETPPPKPVAVGSDIVERRMREAVEKDPSLALKKNRGELAAQVKAEATPHWKRK